ncbi:MAG: hypothetical protein KDD66_06280 [Bdellovibrionales bacterium]|nr:hypothetical protein [Bdellovibrionales bacterium]
MASNSSSKLVPILIAVGALSYFMFSSKDTSKPAQPSAVEAKSSTSRGALTSRGDSSSGVNHPPTVVTAGPGKIPDNIPDDLRKQLEAPPPPIPDDIRKQLNSPPPPLPPDLKAQLEAPPPPLPADLKAQLEAPPPPLPPDIQRALQTPPRIVTEAEVNDPNYIPPEFVEGE